MPNFFVSRPKFAMVISLVITIVGAAAVAVIPVEQLPDVTPPVVGVSAFYPGAGAADVCEAVAAPVEAEVNGVGGMVYMESTCSNNGSYQLNVTFASGTDPDLAAVEVQNRVARVNARLPADVLSQGVAVRKRATNMLLGVSLYSPDGSLDQLALSNYTRIRISDAVARLPGVGEVQIFGARDFSMRVWLDPDLMNAADVTAQDVAAALSRQNVPAAAGQVGSPPAPETQQQTLTILGRGRLTTPEEFADVIIRTEPNGGMIRLGDVARLELGAENYQMNAAVNDLPSAFLTVFPSPGANALNLSRAVHAEMERLSRSFPRGMAYDIKYDSTKFISAAMKEIVTSLALTFIVVLTVVYLFLQSGRAIFIVALIIPVSLVGTVGVLHLFGYSANTLTLFAVILALTMVVDDAIVVVENIERLLAENPDLSPAAATGQAMREIAGPIVATTLVLLAVFVPAAALPGITGVLFRQFAVTISSAMIISSLCALTLSPALCAVLLKRRRAAPRGVFARFNNALDAVRDKYVAAAAGVGRYLPVTLLGLAAAAIAVWGGLRFLPQGFLPDEDQGFFIVSLQLPDGASLNRTASVAERVKAVIAEQQGVDDVLLITGYNLMTGTPAANAGFAYVILKTWGERPPSETIVAGLQAQLNAVPSAMIMALNPPAIMGLGNASGFDLRVLALDGQPMRDLDMAARSVIFAANRDPSLSRVFTSFSASTPQVALDINRDRAALMEVPVSGIFAALQTAFGGVPAGDFNIQGRVFRVMLQNDAQFRDRASRITQLKVRADNGALISLEALAETRPVVGAPFIQKFNQFPAAAVNGSAAPGVSSGEALDAMEKVLAAGLPPGFGYSWSGMSYQERSVSGQAALVFIFACVFAYLFLVAQYESWTIPLAVIVSVVFAIGGALAGLALGGFSNNVYARIGLVLLIGVAAKNAILMVEFSKIRREEGAGIAEAALDGARTRFRAVMMTALSFIFGVMPLMLASGAGAAGRRVIGVTVFSGMLAATVIGIVFIPSLYKWLQTLAERR